MDRVIHLNKIHHRSKERIRDLGEVFTPEHYVEEMLGLLSDNSDFSWSDEEIAFFEPCCGHGNIVLAILEKRLAAFFDKAIDFHLGEHAAYYALANAINTLWAIDIDTDNIFDCRSRIARRAVYFLCQNLSIGVTELRKKSKVYLAHLLCAIHWHVAENELLSALSGSAKEAQHNVQKIKLSDQWLSEHKHQAINFSKTWVDHFKCNQQKNVTPRLFNQAMKFIEQPQEKSMLFDFACSVLVDEKTAYTLNKELEGVQWSQI
ncbi:Uncharacterised protein (plasmid) [Legionella adelaidensis]|uniref:Type I restriction-modification system methyltransferase subunit n=1 Tax=Legionella adelaidensis TaxID=45056 RepID=A0A0W0R0J7_9GAMM|nr:hypothetical protein [Legionella adelaidensis]KTC64598.1 hypothetical protein Lade_1892 [Legionella adelaidensis]VEH86066.1 Uncharacterised protein [Legionella adelaidensis]